jgi:hypothetical protein
MNCAPTTESWFFSRDTNYYSLTTNLIGGNNGRSL